MSHPTHETRFSDASTFDEICVNCGATDSYGGGLDSECPSPKKNVLDKIVEAVEADKKALFPCCEKGTCEGHGYGYTFDGKKF